MSDSFTFFTSYYESIRTLSTKKAKLLLFETICKYALYGEEPEELPAEILGRFVSMKPNIDASIKRRKASVINGSKGGAPTGNQNARKQPKNNLTEQPNNNLNKDKEEDKDKEKEKEMEGEREEENTPHAHGKFSNVFLLASEFEQLKKEYPDCEKTVESLSAHMASTGKTYPNHYATLCKWAMQDKENENKKAIEKAVFGDQTKAKEPKQQYGTYL